MRKRKFVCGIALCLAISMAGCGKGSEEQQAANYYQKELGLDKKDAEQLAHELYGKDKEEPSVTEAPEETVVEPLPELVNSEWWERKVQIYDMIFSYGKDMTEEDIRKIVEGSEYNVELTENFGGNGEVRLDHLMVDGKYAPQFHVWTYNSNTDVTGKYGLLNDGYYYEVGYGSTYDDTPWYDKASIEFKDLKTRDDVLAYLADNGFIEVEESQAAYVKAIRGNTLRTTIYPNETPVEFADVPHYYCKGAQSITIFRIHKLGETDQVIESSGFYPNHYSGAHLNLVNVVAFEFNTDGTIINEPTVIEDYRHYLDKAKNTYGGPSGLVPSGLVHDGLLHL